ncbi:MAG: hypothetical protein WCT23_00560 [Candidatus Neomarinimicrobiota bacterium]
MRLRRITVLLLLLVVVFGAVAFAQGIPKLELKVSEEKMNMSQAEKMGRQEIAYKPGDVIKYTLWAQNVGTGVMTEPVITNPIPDNVVYKANSAKGRQTKIVFSIDGGKTYQSWPPQYKVKDKNGKTVVKAATPEMITHVQWQLARSLNPKESKKLEFEVTVK